MEIPSEITLLNPMIKIIAILIEEPIDDEIIA